MELDLCPLDAQAQTPATSVNALKCDNTDDSGYHTSFTPSSSELSGAFDASSARLCYHSQYITHGSNSICRRRFVRTSNVHSGDFKGPTRPNTSVTPPGFHDDLRSQHLPPRRPLKRSLEQTDEGTWCLGAASTPTSVIAGDLEKLHVADVDSPTPDVNSPTVTPAADSRQRDFANSDYFSLSSIGETSRPLSYPTTPVKSSRCKIAKFSPRCERRSCNKNYSPPKATKENCHPRRSVKKLNFFRTHPLKEPPKCELKPARSTVVPDKKLDMVTMLQERGLPALNTILDCLGPADVYHFSGVCRTWRFICNSNFRAKAKRENYAKFIRVTKENHDNRDSNRKEERESSDSDKLRLRDIHNVINGRRARTADRSPPGTPRTNKFRKFTKCASLDSRVQVWCVRCCQPAKVTEESGGEQWAQCSSDSCAFSFCRFCKCTRHPGKICHSVDAPSPSKRRKHSHDLIGSKKSKRNLRRLLD